MKIDRIKIDGFKSIAELTLEQLNPYSVFAGPNGSGKSNLMDALGFVAAVIDAGAIKAIKQFGGFSHIHCHKFKKARTRTFSFSLDATLDAQPLSYQLTIHDMDGSPSLSEQLTSGGKLRLARKQGELPLMYPIGDTASPVSLPLPADLSGLMFAPDRSLFHYLSQIRIFRFDPLGAKEPDISSMDASELDRHGHNLATMLAVLEKKPDIRQQIMEWMELLVPGMQKVSTERQRLDGRTLIKFMETGMRTSFPANLISDGTIYVLCIMVAVISRAQGSGITIIEEPERGIHPKAITELVQLMRSHAKLTHPIFVTTHNESLIRASSADELWLVNKHDGKTVVKNAGQSSASLGQMNLDTAWLMNLFDGGLPW